MSPSGSRSPHSVFNPFLLNAFQMLHVSPVKRTSTNQDPVREAFRLNYSGDMNYIFPAVF